MGDNREKFVFAGVQFVQLRIFFLQFLMRGAKLLLREFHLRDVVIDADQTGDLPMQVAKRDFCHLKPGDAVFFVMQVLVFLIDN